MGKEGPCPTTIRSALGKVSAYSRTIMQSTHTNATVLVHAPIYQAKTKTRRWANVSFTTSGGAEVPTQHDKTCKAKTLGPSDQPVDNGNGLGGGDEEPSGFKRDMLHGDKVAFINLGTQVLCQMCAVRRSRS